jgi:hypothetical protein
MCMPKAPPPAPPPAPPAPPAPAATLAPADGAETRRDNSALQANRGRNALRIDRTANSFGSVGSGLNIPS